ncbi:class 1 fructose-bisphosphatase [Candidatus Roizmanbacteria bacterium]|nr:class 1 fructose-bisphosphatase [Candidatus Roizmanbacteria bacterium]
MSFQKVTTLTEFLLKEEQRFQNASGSFTILMTQIENASKIIASHIKKTGLVDILGYTGAVNTYGEEVKKLDEFSNNLLIDILRESGQVCAIASEELDEPLVLPDSTGEYIVCFDPLDGSSNVEVNVTIGTIFSIYRKGSTLLQAGRSQVAAGYILYGSSVMFVYTSGQGVNGFTLDPSIGSFLLSHPNLHIPEKQPIYSINEGYFYELDENHVRYLETIKKESYHLRYVGSMVADIHRTLIKGGIFIHPKTLKNPKGKLRLMYEVNPMSFILEQAGGLAYSEGKNPLTVVPNTFSQTVPFVAGCKGEVEKYQKFMENKEEK